MAKREPAPVFRGRKMRCVDRYSGGGTYSIQRGPVLMQVGVHYGVRPTQCTAALYIDGVTFDMKPARSLNGALKQLDRMRLRLRRALEV
jgi:hypothetical protein